MTITVPLKLDINKLSDKKIMIPVQLGPKEPVFGTVKKVGREMAQGIFECDVVVLPEMELYVEEKRFQERQLLFPGS